MLRALPRLLQGMVSAWEGACGTLDQYGMQYTRTFANLCNAGSNPSALSAAAEGACSEQAKMAAV